MEAWVDDEGIGNTRDIYKVNKIRKKNCVAVQYL